MTAGEFPTTERPFTSTPSMSRTIPGSLKEDLFSNYLYINNITLINLLINDLYDLDACIHNGDVNKSCYQTFELIIALIIGWIIECSTLVNPL